VLIFNNSNEDDKMNGLFSEMRKKLLGERPVRSDDVEDEYVELDTLGHDDAKAKVTVRPYAITDFADVKPILDALRDGYTIALVNIKPLKDKDLVELKRAINKLKKTCDAIDGDIAGFSDDYLVLTPGFAKIHRDKKAPVSEVHRE
jgi:SepF-like predicted cell division protein (DUF552 family)